MDDSTSKRGSPAVLGLLAAGLATGCSTTVLDIGEEVVDEEVIDSYGDGGDGDDGSADDDGGDAGPSDDGGDDPLPPPDDPSLDCGTASAKSLDALVVNCQTCHSGDAAPGGFDDVTNVDRMIGQGLIVPGDAEGSPVYLRVAADEMPPAGVEPRPGADEREALAYWIDECVEEPECTHEDAISVDQMMAAMTTDIADTIEIPPDERQFIRYFSIAHLYNMGLCSSELGMWRWALSKALNGLSTETQVVPPKPVDAAETLYRIDLRDYGWDAALWNSIVSQHPLAVEYTRESALDLKAFTGAEVPVLPGDSFVAIASQPPLYHEILEIPGNRSQLEQQLGINVQTDIDDDEVWRSGFLDSGVSVNNRVIERHEFPGASNRTYWLSYDFASNGGTGNIFAFPLDFQEAGNEVIFSLPNGLHAYMIVDGNGNRIDEAPDDIVTDPAQPDQNVTNGLSCMGCHAKGIIPREDELREYVIDSFEFDDLTKQKVAKIHPESEEFSSVQDYDSELYLLALQAAGVPVEIPEEPVNWVFQDFDEDVDIVRAAAELGITVQELSAQLGGLGPDLQALQDGVVKREVFLLNFAAAVCDLNIGITGACGGTAGSTPIPGLPGFP